MHVRLTGKSFTGAGREALKPMLARLVRELPADGYLYEPKRDGFRCLAARDGGHVFVTPATDDRELAAAWLEDFRGGGLDGVLAKRRDLRYESGARAMLKVKHDRTADVVAGMRVGGDPPEVTSLLLGLYDEDGALEHSTPGSPPPRTVAGSPPWSSTTGGSPRGRSSCWSRNSLLPSYQAPAPRTGLGDATGAPAEGYSGLRP